MSDTETPIRSTDPDEVIEANIKAARENNEYERTLVETAPEGPPPIAATDVPRDDEYRERAVTPVSQLSAEKRAAAEQEAAFGPYVGPIDGEGTTLTQQANAVLESATGGKMDSQGNRIHDPGILPGDTDSLPGNRDEQGNLIADHLGNGKPSADQGPIRDAIGAGVSPDASEDEQHGSRGEQDADRDLSDPEEAPLPPEHDPDASEEEQKGGRGLDDRDLGENEAAGQLPEHSEFLDNAEVSPEAAAAVEGDVTPSDGSLPGEDATAAEWRAYAEANRVSVNNTDNRAKVKAALREAGLIK